MGKRFLPTFSRLDVAAHCVFPWTGGLKWPKRARSSFAGVGRAVSSAAECVSIWGGAPVDDIAETNGLTPGETTQLGQSVAHLRDLLNYERDLLVWRKAEVALAYDLRTGKAREVRQNHPRDYSDCRRDEVMGTPDLVHVTKAGELVVRDWKTGRYAWNKDPGETRQLRALGLCAARAYGFRSVTLELAQVEADGIRIRRAVLDAFELACVADDLRTMFERIVDQGWNERPVPGAWCAGSYCPVAATCPATLSALEAVNEASELKHPLTVEITSPEHAAYTLERIKVAERALADIHQAVKDYAASEGPLPLSDGKRWGPVQYDGRERIDLSVPGAMDAVAQHLGPFAATQAVERKTSKAALKAAATAQQQQRGQGVKQFRALLEDLRSMGALKQGAPYEKFEAFTPKG